MDARVHPIIRHEWSNSCQVIGWTHWHDKQIHSFSSIFTRFKRWSCRHWGWRAKGSGRRLEWRAARNTNTNEPFAGIAVSHHGGQWIHGNGQNRTEGVFRCAFRILQILKFSWLIKLRIQAIEDLFFNAYSRSSQALISFGYRPFAHDVQ